MRFEVAVLKKCSRITGVARDKLASDLKKKYEKGASIRALAESTGRPYGFVHRVLSESGVTLRGRAGATRPQKKQPAAFDCPPGLTTPGAGRPGERSQTKRVLLAERWR